MSEGASCACHVASAAAITTDSRFAGRQVEPLAATPTLRACMAGVRMLGNHMWNSVDDMPARVGLAMWIVRRARVAGEIIGASTRGFEP